MVKNANNDCMSKSVKSLLLVVFVLIVPLFLVGCTTDSEDCKARLEARIKSDFFTEIVLPSYSAARRENVSIRSRHGEINGYYIIRFNTIILMPDVVTPTEVIVVDDNGNESKFIFDYTPAHHAIAWRNGSIMNIMDAFREGIVSVENLEDIMGILELY